MASYLVFIVLLVLVDAAHMRHHPRFGKRSEEHEEPQRHVKRVMCTDKHDSERGEIIAKSSCGAPKDDYIVLELASYEMATPSAVWVKRCKGTCEHSSGTMCMPRETVIRDIPIRIHNTITKKQACAIYQVEEHLSCGCCMGQCTGNRVLDPRKCSCHCPNMEERRSCLRKRNNMRWNRSKCACEPRPKRRVQ